MHAPGAKAVAFTSQFKERCLIIFTNWSTLKTASYVTFSVKVMPWACWKWCMVILKSFKCGVFSFEIQLLYMKQTNNTITSIVKYNVMIPDKKIHYCIIMFCPHIHSDYANNVSDIWWLDTFMLPMTSLEQFFSTWHAVQ